MAIHWSDPLSQDGALAGLGCSHDGMGSWLSDLVKRNKNTIGSVIGGIANTIIPGIAPAPATSPPPAPAPVVVTQTKSPDWLPLALGGALLLALKK